MLEYIKGDWLKYYLGHKEIFSYVDALHPVPEKADLFTDLIAEAIMAKTGCSGVIATVSRSIADLNRAINHSNKEAVLEHRKAIGEILNHLNILDSNNKASRPFLHLAIHGMRNRQDRDIEIGTRRGVLCNPEVKDWLVQQVKEGLDCKVAADKVFVGDESLEYHRNGDPEYREYPGFGPNYNVFQIELNYDLRTAHRQTVVELLSQIILNFNKQFKGG